MARPTYAEVLTYAQQDATKLLAMLISETTPSGTAFGGPGVVSGSLTGDTTPAIAAAGDYADNDIMSDSASAGVAWVFADMAGVNGGSGEIVGAALTCSVAALASTFRLWLFNANPSASSLNDNAAFSLHASDQDKLVQTVDFATTASLGGVAGSITAALSKPFTCAVADNDLYGILQATDAITNETAGMIVTVKLMVKRG